MSYEGKACKKPMHFMCISCASNASNVPMFLRNLFSAIIYNIYKIVRKRWHIIIGVCVFLGGYIHTDFYNSIKFYNSIILCVPLFSVKRIKQQFNIYINKELVEEFKKFIAKKYGKYEKGLISFEVEQALRAWIGLHTQNTQSFSPKINPIPKVSEKFLQVKEYLRVKYKYTFFPGQTIPRRLLVEAIQNSIGMDKRTIKKYLRLFIHYHLLKPISPEVYEVL